MEALQYTKRIPPVPHREPTVRDPACRKRLAANSTANDEVAGWLSHEDESVRACVRRVFWVRTSNAGGAAPDDRRRMNPPDARSSTRLGLARLKLQKARRSLSRGAYFRHQSRRSLGWRLIGGSPDRCGVETASFREARGRVRLAGRVVCGCGWRPRWAEACSRGHQGGQRRAFWNCSFPQWLHRSRDAMRSSGGQFPPSQTTSIIVSMSRLRIVFFFLVSCCLTVTFPHPFFYSFELFPLSVFFFLLCLGSSKGAMSASFQEGL